MHILVHFALNIADLQCANCNLLQIGRFVQFAAQRSAIFYRILRFICIFANLQKLLKALGLEIYGLCFAILRFGILAKPKSRVSTAHCLVVTLAFHVSEFYCSVSRANVADM